MVASRAVRHSRRGSTSLEATTSTLGDGGDADWLARFLRPQRKALSTMSALFSPFRRTYSYLVRPSSPVPRPSLPRPSVSTLEATRELISSHLHLCPTRERATGIGPPATTATDST